MAKEEEIRDAAIKRGRCVQRNNALAALVCGFGPALFLSFWYPRPPILWVVGFLVGLLWANAFEYVYHRFLLHLPGNVLAKGHLEHHATLGTPGEGEHVNFAGSPLRVAILFLSNGLPVVAADLGLGFGIAPGMLAAFAVYFVLTEEIHWRIHLGGWLPPGLRGARRYHLAHHDLPDSRFSVFLPLFDWVFGPAHHR